MLSKVKDEYEKFKKRKELSRSRIISHSETELSEHMESLVNNRQGSDVRFLVGKRNPVTLYGHSYILRCRSQYFAALLDDERNWNNDHSECVISNPNISAVTFEDILRYVYTGNPRGRNSDNIVELITAADGMDLEELKSRCREDLIRTVKYIFSDDEDEDEDNTNIPEVQIIPINTAIHTHIIPALNIPSDHPTSYLSRDVMEIILPNMSFIVNSPNIFTTFVNMISSEVLTNIIKSDNLEMSEQNVWDLVLSWACHQKNISRSAIEASLRNPDPSIIRTTASNDRLNVLKEALEPFLPLIRFSLLNRDDYTHLSDILSGILPNSQYSKINSFFLSYDGTGLLDTPRMNSPSQKIPSIIVTQSTIWKQLRESILESGGITGCRSIEHLKFDLIFRASVHGFSSSTFHQRCDNKGPTLVIVRSADGHLFGGANFSHWKSNVASWSSSSNFLFSLTVRLHQTHVTLFKIGSQSHDRRCFYHSAHGPTFGSCNDFNLSNGIDGWHDLYIADSANTNSSSHSHLPHSYNGDGASCRSLAGAHKFRVSDYEVFTISKYM